MAWLAPVLGVIGSIFGQNQANQSANANNANQQQQQQANAQSAIAMARAIMAPWLQSGNTPFAGATGQMGAPPGPIAAGGFSQPTQTIGGGAPGGASAPRSAGFGGFNGGAPPPPLGTGAGGGTGGGAPPQFNPQQLAQMVSMMMQRQPQAA